MFLSMGIYLQNTIGENESIAIKAIKYMDRVSIDKLHLKYDMELSYMEFSILLGIKEDTIIDTLLNFMESSGNKRYNDIYKELIKKGYKDSSSMPVIGKIVYGTKDELKKLVKTHI